MEGDVSDKKTLANLSDDEDDMEYESMESEEDAQSDNDTNDEGQKSGLANVMAGILRKQSPKSTVILSKTKTDREREYQKQKQAFRERDDLPIESEDTEKVKKKKTPLFGPALEAAVERERRLKKKRWEEMGHVKPDITKDREREKRLQRIATKGVVQLFNAVKKQQKCIEDKLKSVGSSERKRDKVLKSVSKGAFLDMLKESTHNVSSGGANTTANQVKTSKSLPAKDVDDNEKPSWGILRDDFMMGAKMKDWDKESDNENEPGKRIEDDSSDYESS